MRRRPKKGKPIKVPKVKRHAPRVRGFSMIANDRRFTGETMSLVGSRTRTKPSAQGTAKTLRNRWRARVLKHAHGHAVYRGGVRKKLR